MTPPIKDPLLELQSEIDKLIKNRAWYESMDFYLAHFFLWTSILASFGSSIIIASGEVLSDNPSTNKVIIAIIAGFPALVILIDKTFDFAKRAVWGTIYRIELEELRDELIFKKDAQKSSKKLRELKKRNELAYSKIGFFAARKENPNEDN